MQRIIGWPAMADRHGVSQIRRTRALHHAQTCMQVCPTAQVQEVQSRCVVPAGCMQLVGWLVVQLHVATTEQIMWKGCRLTFKTVATQVAAAGCAPGADCHNSTAQARPMTQRTCKCRLTHCCLAVHLYAWAAAIQPPVRNGQQCMLHVCCHCCRVQVGRQQTQLETPV
jgi:hypothetical protein